MHLHCLWSYVHQILKIAICSLLASSIFKSFVVRNFLTFKKRNCCQLLFQVSFGALQNVFPFSILTEGCGRPDITRIAEQSGYVAPSSTHPSDQSKLKYKILRIAGQSINKIMCSIPFKNFMGLNVFACYFVCFYVLTSFKMWKLSLEICQVVNMWWYPRSGPHTVF